MYLRRYCECTRFDLIANSVGVRLYSNFYVVLFLEFLAMYSTFGHFSTLFSRGTLFVFTRLVECLIYDNNILTLFKILNKNI